MADVFISYASSDRSYVALLVERFEAEGLTVWWDRHIETGTSFDRRIEEALDGASCIVVVWSKSSIDSDWVRAEAAEGLKRNILVPILLDEVKPPLLFRQKQAISLVDWKSGRSAEPLENVLPSIASILNSYRDSHLPVSTQRSWVLGQIANLTDQHVLDVVPRRIISVGLQYFENLFLYAPRNVQTSGLDAAQLRKLTEEEGLDGYIYGDVTSDEQQLRLTLWVQERGRDAISKTMTVGDSAELPAAIAKLLLNSADVLQGAMPRQSQDLRNYLGNLNIDCIYHTGLAMDCEERHDFAGAIREYQAAISIDENFLSAYRAWAVDCVHLGQKDRAADLAMQGIRSLTNESDRERHQARFVYYAMHNEDYDKAAIELESLLKISPLDARVLANLAVSRFYQLEFDAARELASRFLQLYPKYIQVKQHAAFYALYAGAFDEADRLAREVTTEDSAFTESIVVQALTRAVAGDVDAAAEIYRSRLGTAAQADSLLLHGLADLAMAKRMWAQADDLIDRGIALDQEVGNLEWQARKLLMRAETSLHRGDVTLANRLLQETLGLSTSTGVLAMAAVLSLQHGLGQLEMLSGHMRKKVNPHGRAYARMIEATIAFARDDLGESTRQLGDAMNISDLWLIRFCAALLYAKTGLELEARDELAVCASRSGEAVSAVLDDLPTFRYHSAVQRLLEGA